MENSEPEKRRTGFSAPHRAEETTDVGAGEKASGSGSKGMAEKMHPEMDNPIRAPFIPLAVSRRYITVLGWCVAGLTLVVILLSIGFTASINRKPWVLVATPNGYQEAGVGRANVTRKDVERFLNFVIPNIYGSVNAEGPGLEEIRGLVNENILIEQKKTLEQQGQFLKQEGVSQFAIVTGINPETMVINREKNIAYAEALGTIVLTREKKSRKTEVQWRCLMYLVEPTTQMSASTPGGRMAGNRMGIFLQQIAEQPPGTINEDSPKPTMTDMQERNQEDQKPQ
jgi:hypothetical protein